MSHWTRNARLAALAKERGLKFTGFRESLRGIIKESLTWEHYLEQCAESDEECSSSKEDYKDALDFEFGEWFGDCRVAPAAHRVFKNGRFSERDEYNITVEVYEVENSIEISGNKLAAYGRIADGDGPQCDLHIIDRYDHEIIVPSEYLMNWAFCDLWDAETTRERIKELRSRAKVQHHAPTIVDDDRAKDYVREIVGLRRKLARTQHSELAPAIQNIVYGLGLRKSHREIARETGFSPAVVRSCAKLMAAKRLDPTKIVKDSHARWKAAYDAVKELGISI